MKENDEVVGVEIFNEEISVGMGIYKPSLEADGLHFQVYILGIQIDSMNSLIFECLFQLLEAVIQPCSHRHLLIFKFFEGQEVLKGRFAEHTDGLALHLWHGHIRLKEDSLYDGFELLFSLQKLKAF